MLNFQSLVDHSKISKPNENFNSTLARIEYLRCYYTKFQLKILIVFSKRTQVFADFTIRMIGNEMGHLLKCVKLY